MILRNNTYYEKYILCVWWELKFMLAEKMIFNLEIQNDIKYKDSQWIDTEPYFS